MPALDLPTDVWDEAYRRVESYLHACGVEPRLLLTEIAISIVDQARERAAVGAPEHPVALAFMVLKQRMNATFGEAFLEPDGTEEMARARGRLALHLADAAPRWGELLARAQNSSAEWVEVLRAHPLQSGPDIRLSKMPPAKLEFGFGDTDETAPAAGRWLPIPAMAITLLVLGAMGAAWATSH